ncbi:hypothetical protein [Gracilibacillus dipsosauri]|uniref:hypothetical protein n=1 Tax=Gracilibacillus dipsosauri TaxID=178340 RepID=UPI002409AF37
MAVVRRKRMSDGTFGPLEKVFENEETPEEKAERLDRENKQLRQDLSIAIIELTTLLASGGKS